MEDKPIKILLIEGNPDDGRLIQELLADVKVINPVAPTLELEWADQLALALERLAGGSIDVVLCNLTLPDSWGLDTFFTIHAQSPQVPVVVLGSSADEAVAVQAVREGAQDYLVKERVDSDLLVRSLRYAIERKRAEEILQQRNRELTTLNSIIATITAALSQGQVLQGIVDTAPLLFPQVSGVTIQLIDEATDNLLTQADSYGIATDRLRRLVFAPGEGIAGRAVTEHRIINVADVTTDPRFVPGPVKPPYRSLLVAPFLFENKVLGTLSLESNLPGAFEERDEWLIQVFTGYAAIAILLASASVRP